MTAPATQTAHPKGKDCWYFQSTWACVLCGLTRTYRERRTGEKPTDPAERYEYIEEACGVHFV